MITEAEEIEFTGQSDVAEADQAESVDSEEQRDADDSDHATFDQAGIDALFGDVGPAEAPRAGVRAIIESNVINHDRLPMLEVICDRVVRRFATSMRNLTSDAIDVHLEDVATARFGEFINHVSLPAMIGVFRVPQWENYGLVTAESELIYAIVDALLGGRRGSPPAVIDGRAFTSIEIKLVSRMIELILADTSAAFGGIAEVNMNLERIETSPRFAAIAGPTNLCAVATFRVDMEGRGGKFSLLFPYVTLEPVRSKLLQRFMGEKLGRDNIWETHMEAEVRQLDICLDVVLGEAELPLNTTRMLGVGDTIPLLKDADAALELQCGGVTLGTAQIGRAKNNIAIKLLTDISEEAR